MIFFRFWPWKERDLSVLLMLINRKPYIPFYTVYNLTAVSERMGWSNSQLLLSIAWLFAHLHNSIVVHNLIAGVAYHVYDLLQLKLYPFCFISKCDFLIPLLFYLQRCVHLQRGLLPEDCILIIYEGVWRKEGCGFVVAECIFAAVLNSVRYI